MNEGNGEFHEEHPGDSGIHSSGEHIACDRTTRCTVNVLWIRVRDAITGTLDGMTLADLVPARHITLHPRLPASTAIPAEEPQPAATLTGASS